MSLCAAKKKTEGTSVLDALCNIQTENSYFLLFHFYFIENCGSFNRLNYLRNRSKISLHLDLPYRCVPHFRLELNAYSFSLSKPHHIFKPHMSAWYHMWWGTCLCRKGLGDLILPGCIGLSHVPEKCNLIPTLFYTTSRIINQTKLPNWCVRTEPLVSGVFQAMWKPGQEGSRRL